MSNGKPPTPSTPSVPKRTVARGRPVSESVMVPVQKPTYFASPSAEPIPFSGEPDNDEATLWSSMMKPGPDFLRPELLHVYSKTNDRPPETYQQYPIENVSVLFSSFHLALCMMSAGCMLVALIIGLLDLHTLLLPIIDVVSTYDAAENAYVPIVWIKYMVHPCLTVFGIFLGGALSHLLQFVGSRKQPHRFIDWFYRRVNYPMWIEYAFTSAYSSTIIALRGGIFAWDTLMLTFLLRQSWVFLSMMNDNANDPSNNKQHNFATYRKKKIGYWISWIPWLAGYAVLFVHLNPSTSAFVWIAAVGQFLFEFLFQLSFYGVTVQWANWRLFTNYLNACVLLQSIGFITQVFVGFTLIIGAIASHP